MLSNCGDGEDSWESLGHKEIKPVHPKGNQPWIFIGRTDAEAEAPILWPPDMKSWLIGKDPMLGKVERTRRRRTEDEVVGWHHWFNAPELKQTPGSSEGQGSLAGCSPWGRKESDMTERLNSHNVTTLWDSKYCIIRLIFWFWFWLSCNLIHNNLFQSIKPSWPSSLNECCCQTIQSYQWTARTDLL